MKNKKDLQIQLIPYDENTGSDQFDLDRVIYDLDGQIKQLSSQADSFDYIISAASGLMCSMLDIFWVGEFDLERGRDFASEKVESFVKKTASMLGCEQDDLKASVKFLEKKFLLPSDGNTPDFGGGLQHHLRDFAHHPTIVGLAFSLLTQFTYKSYGTDENGTFIIREIPEKSRVFIGKDTSQKIINGTIIWFFHLVSDMAGSGNTAGLSGGTGIPGPLLSMAKELSVLPIFRNLKIQDNGISSFLSRLFNGTLLAKRNENGTIIKDTVLKMDLRGELGAAAELGRQAVPVIANECIVRTFYFIRHLAAELKNQKITQLGDFKKIQWEDVLPANNPTISRMLTIATGVFTTVDVASAAATQKFWVSINYVGVGRFALAIGEDVSWCVKARNVKKIRKMYEEIKRFSYTDEDNRIYGRMGKDMEVNKFGLTLEQTEILYNLEYLKTLNDIQQTKIPVNGEKIKQLKMEWLSEWKDYIGNAFSSFTQVEGAQIKWYSKKQLLNLIEKEKANNIWFRLVLLEAMLFEPYYPLSVEKNKKGIEVPTAKYKTLQNALFGYKEQEGDKYLDQYFSKECYVDGYVKRLRKCYKKVIRELNEVLKTALTSLAIAAGITITTIATAGAFAPTIAVALVGSNFAGLSGAALTSACLAYLGGGAIAAGGLGMAGGTIAIVGGGAALGLGVGAGVGGAVGAVSIAGKKEAILQSAKLLVSVREIFLNDEHDLEYSNSVMEQYVEKIAEIEKGLVDLRLKADEADGKEKKELKKKIKEAEDTVEAMKIARKSMRKFVSSFETGMQQTEEKSEESS